MILRETPASCVRRIALRWSVSLPYVPFALLLSGIVVVFTVFLQRKRFICFDSKTQMQSGSTIDDTMPAHHPRIGPFLTKFA